MATYFHSSNPPEIQPSPPDALQTLVLMNPTTYIHHFPDTSPPPPQPPPHPGGNLIFLPHQNLHHHHHMLPNQLVGIPLPTTATSDGSTLHGLVPRMHSNLWTPVDPNATARDTPRAQQQGLSLSLSSQQAGMGIGSFRVERDVASQGEDVRGSPSSASAVTNVNGGVQGIYQSVFVSSKYLKAAQELLDEAVNVNNGIKTSEMVGKKGGGAHGKATGETSGTAASGGDEGSVKQASELSAAERQEIQMKKAKLINMLDEVDQRYRQYHQQMQIVIASFEQAAGIGSARTYTALALKTISKQFRCLKDAIAAQIGAANKSLGEEDYCFGSKSEGSRLKYVDHHLRQQRALQQLGMIQHNAWRPQRGLPERSVSVLRAWLFEHFLHPYPKDSDKHMLAKQTGLTRSQVSNWFINARVRLWKPMVEEMYVEEMKGQELNGSEDKSGKSDEDPAIKILSSQQKGPATETDARSLNSNQDTPSNQNTPTVSVSNPLISSPTGDNVRNQFSFSFMGSSELEGITQGSPKKLRNQEIIHFPSSINMDVKANEGSNEQLTIKFGEERQGREGYSFMGTQANFMGGFGQYPIGEIGRFEADQFTQRFSGNGVSLTLGLPHCDTLSGGHQTFLPNQNIQLGRRLDQLGESNEYGAINTSTTHSSAAFENMNMQNPKRFAAQLLPDFVT